MIFSFYNCIYLPFEQAFVKTTFCDFSNFDMIDASNYFIDFIFIVDIVLNFNTTFQNENTGREVSNRKKIAMNYIKGMFIVDFLAVIPLYELSCIGE